MRVTRRRPSPNPEPESEQAPSEEMQAIIAAIRGLVRRLPRADQERVLREVTDQVRPLVAPRAGETLGAIVQLLPRRRHWTVEEIRKEVGASAKDIYNALGYLTRKGQIRRIGYGRYLVGGKAPPPPLNPPPASE